MKKLMAVLLVIFLLVPEMALAAGYTGGDGVWGVYLDSGAIYQAYYDASVVDGGADYILGVYDAYVYYQTPRVNGVSSLKRQGLYLISEEYQQAGDALENMVVATGNLNSQRPENNTLSEAVYGLAVLDEVSGYVYFIDAADKKVINVAADYPSLGLVVTPIYTAENEVVELRLTANGLAFRTAEKAYLYIPMLRRALECGENVFEAYKQKAMFNGSEVLLKEDGTLIVKLDAANDVSLTINDSVQEFVVYGGYLFYLRRTRWLTEIDRFDPVTRVSKVMTRVLKEHMPQLVAAGDYLYIIDTDYTVYRVSPTTGRYAEAYKLGNSYQGQQAAPRLYGAGEELLVYDQPLTGDTNNLTLFYKQFVGSTEHPTLPAQQQPTPTPPFLNTPTPAPTTYATMQKGSRGDDVKLLQEKLIELGYLNDTADGVYGTKTQNAVQMLQSDIGLNMNGKVDNELMQKLVNGEIQPYSPYLTVKRGDKGERVTALQTRLKQLGYLAGAVDGNFGGATYNAVLLFQKQIGLEETGVADEDTLRALYSDSAPVNTSYIDLRNGDSGIRVAELVDRLIELYYLPSTARGSYYTDEVENAVKKVQARMGYWQSGTATRLMQSWLFGGKVPENSDYITLGSQCAAQT